MMAKRQGNPPAQSLGVQKVVNHDPLEIMMVSKNKKRRPMSRGCITLHYIKIGSVGQMSKMHQPLAAKQIIIG